MNFAKYFTAFLGTLALVACGGSKDVAPAVDPTPAPEAKPVEAKPVAEAKPIEAAPAPAAKAEAKPEAKK